MNIETQLLKEDYIDCYKFFYFRRKKPERITIIMALAFLIAAFKFGEHDFVWLIYFLKVIFFVSVLFLINFLLPYFIVTRKLTIAINSNDSPIGTKIFSISNQGITVISDNDNKSFFNWGSIKILDKNANSIFVIFTNKKHLVIPLRFFLSRLDAEDFFNNIRKNLTNKQSETTNKTEGRHLYLQGLLGLIPLVGVFVGVSLIFRGIFRYKDKFLVIIGSADILFTVAVYFTLFYQLNYGEAQFNTTNKIRLDAVVKDLENYKFQTGNYPDSLEQLFQIDRFAPIKDLFLLRHPENKKNNFIYQVSNKSYVLFSSGFDEIPNTSDDIFP